MGGFLELHPTATVDLLMDEGHIRISPERAKELKQCQHIQIYDGTGIHDSDMGAIGEDYPNGTVYLCHFSGRFSDIEKVDEYSYSMTLSELNCDDEGGEEWIEDGICYVPAAPYGMEDGETFVLYLPDTPTDGLDEDFLSWWPGCYAPEGAPETLERYGLLNAQMGYGFFSDPM